MNYFLYTLYHILKVLKVPSAVCCDHTDKGFCIVNEAEVDAFLEFLAFLTSQLTSTIWSLVPLPFLNPACTPGSSRFTYYWSLAWRRILTINLPACEMSTIVWWFEHSLAQYSHFLWDWNENWPFPALWPLLSFPNLLKKWVQHFYQHHLLGFAEAEAPVSWSPDSKSWLIGKDPDTGKDWRQKGKGVAEDELVS